MKGGKVRLFYRDMDFNTIAINYITSGNVWSDGYVIRGGYLEQEDNHGPSVASYRNRLHVVVRSNVLAMGWTRRSYMASCIDPCLDGDWTRWVEIDGVADNSAGWSYLFPEDSHLVRADYFPQSGSSPALMTWRWKNSE